MTRVCVLTNATSGHNRKWRARVAARLAAYPKVAHHVTHSPQEARTLITELAAAPPDVVVINGGDGTVAATLGLMLAHWPEGTLPLVVVLPGGTANMTAGDIGIASSPARALRRLCRWLDRGAPLEGEIRSRHIMRVEGAPDGAVRHGMFLGTGAIMQATQFAHDKVHSRGLGGEISLGVILIRAVWGLVRQDPRFYQPTQVRLDITRPGAAPIARESAPMLILVASTLERLFLGIRPFWASGPGIIGLTAIRGGAAHFPRAILSVLRGRPNRLARPETGYESFRGARIEMRFDGALNLDGELVDSPGGENPLIVSTEGPLRFLRPAG